VPIWRTELNLGAPYQVTYESCVQGQTASPIYDQCTTATASFNVTGGGSMASQAFAGLWISSIIPCVTGATVQTPFLSYGILFGSGCSVNYPGSTLGITFTPSGAPAGGTYSYAQIVNSYNTIAMQGNITTGCNWTTGIDTNYPYKGTIGGTSPLQAEDDPNTELPTSPGYFQNFSFDATMFLLWTSNLTNSTPVPIGYQEWGVTGSAQQNASGAWVATTTIPPTPGPVGPFITSNASQMTDGHTTLQYGYPVWDSVTGCD
jgi:hypothetical protein